MPYEPLKGSTAMRNGFTEDATRGAWRNKSAWRLVGGRVENENSLAGLIKARCDVGFYDLQKKQYGRGPQAG